MSFRRFDASHLVTTRNGVGGCLIDYNYESAHSLILWVDHLSSSSQFVEEDGHLSNVAENVVFALVSYVAGKVFADDAVPVGRILLVKEAFDIFGNVLLGVLFVHD